MMAQLMIDIPDEFVHLFENNEVIELVNRTTNQRFSEFLKVAVQELPKDNSEELLNAVMNSSSLAALSSTASLLATGVGFANLAVSIVGFKMMSDKLNVISEKVDKVNSGLDKLHEKYDYDIFIKPLNRLENKAKEITGSLQNNIKVDQKDFKDTIIAYQEYLLEICDKCLYQGIDSYLDLYYKVCPVFTNLVTLYYQTGYENISMQKDFMHENWLKVFYRNTDNKFMQSMQDYYLIEKQYHNKDVNEIIKGHLDSNQAMLMQIEDTVTLMKYVKIAEDYQWFMDAVQKSATKKAKEELLPELYKVCSKEKAEQILEKAVA